MQNLIKRDIQPLLEKYAKGYPAIALLGPRQTGKTTIAKITFPNHTYISLESLNNRVFAQEDPEKFLKTHENKHGLILDEIQYVPELLSYIQTHIDAFDRPGYFILTGSQNFIVHESVSQTLAGRVAILTLLPFSVSELKKPKLLSDSLYELIVTGGYPRIYNKSLDPTTWYLNYVTTYIERDVRQITKVIDLATFDRFLKLCAGRVGQLINFSSLASDAGISHNTAKSWLSVLQASYIIHLMQPYYKNFSKRLVKSPKLYFYDTGLLCALLNITNAKQLETHYLFGGIFESFVMNELAKTKHNAGIPADFYFWRDSHGHEVDFIIEHAGKLLAIEIKAGQTISRSFFKGLTWWNELSNNDPENSYLIYTGQQKQIRSQGNVLNWQSIHTVFE